jgi:hypothetical protein
MAHSISSACADSNQRSTVRLSYLRFPAWTQPFWTLLTGKPLPHERPLLRIAPAASMLFGLVVAIVLCGVELLMLGSPDAATRIGGGVAAPIVALYITGYLRKAQVVYGHHAIHGALFKSRGGLNAYAAQALTILALAQNEGEYEREHLDHHRRSIFTTLLDADASLLYEFGIRPGNPIGTLKLALLKTLCSPRFHLWFLKARLLSNLRRPLVGRGCAIAWIAALVIGAPLRFGFAPTLVAIWLPYTILYQISALLQFATEHVWLADGPDCPRIRTYAERCHGRFCGERLPGGDGVRPSVREWLGWWARTLFLHVPMRLSVLVGDLPAHDWHHLASSIGHRSTAWPFALYERQRAIDSGRSAGMEHREIWGVFGMIEHVLRGMAQAPALIDEHAIAGDASKASVP